MVILGSLSLTINHCFQTDFLVLALGTAALHVSLTISFYSDLFSCTILDEELLMHIRPFLPS